MLGNQFEREREREKALHGFLQPRKVREHAIEAPFLQRPHLSKVAALD